MVEAFGERVNPEVVVELRVPDGHVASGTFVSVSLGSKPSQCGGVMQLAERALFCKRPESVRHSQPQPASENKYRTTILGVSNFLDRLHLSLEVTCSVIEEGEISRIEQVTAEPLGAFLLGRTHRGRHGDSCRSHVDDSEE